MNLLLKLMEPDNPLRTGIVKKNKNLKTVKCITKKTLFHFFNYRAIYVNSSLKCHMLRLKQMHKYLITN